MITVYSNPTCQPCKATCRQLEQRGIEFKKVDVSVDDQGRRDIEALGYRELPVVVSGEQHWSGFRPDLIAALEVGR